MPEAVEDVVACTHACQEGCGRTYDAIFIQVVDGSTLFYCLPCLHSFLVSLTRAMVEPDDPQVREVVENTDLSDIALVTTTDDPFSAWNPPSIMQEDEFTFDGLS